MAICVVKQPHSGTGSATTRRATSCAVAWRPGVLLCPVSLGIIGLMLVEVGLVGPTQFDPEAKYYDPKSSLTSRAGARQVALLRRIRRAAEPGSTALSSGGAAAGDQAQQSPLDSAGTGRLAEDLLNRLGPLLTPVVKRVEKRSGEHVAACRVISRDSMPFCTRKPAERPAGGTDPRWDAR